MKLKMMIVVLMLLTGAQVSARDLSQMRNFRELEGLVYSKLPANEQEQLLRLAVSSNLPAQSVAARGAISRHFKGINWNELVNIYANKGFNGVKAKLGLTGTPAASVVKTPAIVQIEKQQEQIEKEAVKVEQAAIKQEQIAEQKQAEKQQLLQKEQEQQAKTEAEIKQAEAAGKQKEAAELRKKLTAEKEKAAQEQAIIDAQIAENQKGLERAQKEQERLKKEEEKLSQERAQKEKEAQKKIEEFTHQITQLVNRINLMLDQKQAEHWFPASEKELVEARNTIAKSDIPESEKSKLIQEVNNTIQALDTKLKAIQKEEAEKQAAAPEKEVKASYFGAPAYKVTITKDNNENVTKVIYDKRELNLFGQQKKLSNDEIAALIQINEKIKGENKAIAMRELNDEMFRVQDRLEKLDRAGDRTSLDYKYYSGPYDDMLRAAINHFKK